MLTMCKLSKRFHFIHYLNFLIIQTDSSDNIKLPFFIIITAANDEASYMITLIGLNFASMWKSYIIS